MHIQRAAKRNANIRILILTFALGILIALLSKGQTTEAIMITIWLLAIVILSKIDDVEKKIDRNNRALGHFFREYLSDNYSKAYKNPMNFYNVVSKHDVLYNPLTDEVEIAPYSPFDRLTIKEYTHKNWRVYKSKKRTKLYDEDTF